MKPWANRRPKAEASAPDDLPTAPECPRPFEEIRGQAEGEIVTTSGGDVRGSHDSPTVAEEGDASTSNASRVQHFEAFPATFGRYVVQRQLGEGGMGAVYLAWDTTLQRPVALKIPGGAAHRRVLKRFLREARAAAALDHPHICPVYDHGEVNGVQYLTLKYIDGPTLADLLQSGPLAIRQAVECCSKIARALEAAHRAGVVHRDLKPSNIMLDQAGQPYVTDFGLARKEADDQVLTRSGDVFGTPAYMSPEQLRGEGRHIGPASDVYSLGVALFQMLTGRLPFRGSFAVTLSKILHEEPPPASSCRPEIDQRLDAICRKAMAKEVNHRFASAAEFAAALEEHLQASHAKANRLESRISTSLGSGRSPVRLWGLTALLLAVAGALILQFGGSQTDELRPAATADASDPGSRQAPPKPAPGPPVVRAPLFADEPSANTEIEAAIAELPVVPDRVEPKLAAAVRHLANDLADFLTSEADVGEATLGSFTPTQPEMPRNFGLLVKQMLAGEMKRLGVAPKSFGTRYSVKGEFTYYGDTRKVTIEAVVREGAVKRSTLVSDVFEVSSIPALMAGRPRLHVFIMAADQYHGALELPFSVTDADALVADWRRFSSKFFDPGQTYRFVNEDISAEKMAVQIDAVCEELKTLAYPGDLLVAYIAGHAAAYDGRYYFVPPHEELLQLSQLTSASREMEIIERIGVPWTTLSRLSEAACRKLVLLDTSYSGAVAPESELLSGSELAAEPPPQTAMLLIAATSAEQEAKGTPEGSLFTRCVRDALAGMADGIDETGRLDANPKNHEVDLLELVRYVTAQTPRRTRAIGVQTPTHSPELLFQRLNFPLTTYYPSDLP